MPAAIVDPSGLFMGWATFHVISATGGSDKHVYGYFQASFESARLSISACSANDCPRYLGSVRPQAVELSAARNRASTVSRVAAASPDVSTTRVAAGARRSASPA